jgi:membrane protease YdiL (CAAX protease family)
LPSPNRITTLAFAIYAPLTAGAFAWAWLDGRRPIWSLETPWLSEPYTVRLAISLGLGAALASLIVATTPYIVKRAAWARALHEELRSLIGSLTSTEITTLALASGFAEELFFRGAMQPAIGLFVTSFIFGLVHVGPRRIFVVWGAWAFLVGLAFGVIFELTGVLWGPVLAHVWINHRNMTFIRRH